MDGRQSNPNYMTWVIVKHRNSNNKGEVTLKSNKPYEKPDINFKIYSDNMASRDLKAVVDGLKFARRLNSLLSMRLIIEEETIPGKNIDTDEKLAQWARQNSWGHHACCSAKMGGNSDPMAVVDSNFRVHGVRGLRVVDASVFPFMPSFFPALSIYQLSEKASDVIKADYLKK